MKFSLKCCSLGIRWESTGNLSRPQDDDDKRNQPDRADDCYPQPYGERSAVANRRLQRDCAGTWGRMLKLAHISLEAVCSFLQKRNSCHGSRGDRPTDKRPMTPGYCQRDGDDKRESA